MQPGDHARASEELEVMRESDGIAGIHQLAKHFLIGENLTGIGAGKLEQAAEQRWLIDPVEQKDVSGQGGFDQGVVNVVFPTCRGPASTWIKRRGSRTGKAVGSRDNCVSLDLLRAM